VSAIQEFSVRRPTPRVPVKSRSLGKQVAEAVRDMILVGELLPGEIVTQEHLAGVLSVSTMPVREALLALAHEGLIEARPNRSFQVARTTREDIEDIYRVHAFLAGELTARAAKAADARLIEELREVQRLWREAEPSRLADLNWRFHRAVHTAADSPKLSLILKNITRYIPQSFYTLVDGGPEFVERSHAELLDAIEARDPIRGREAAERNVRLAGQLLIDYFLERGYWGSPKAGALLGAVSPSGDGASP
jgi:DNA-binding GntR family transcriptional regulator